MSKCNPLQLIQGIVKVVSLPSIYFKVEEALANPKTSNKYLADILSEDTALAARILRLANSAFFNFPSSVDTMTQATIVIGTRQIREIVLASSIVNTFKDIPSDLVNMESFWRHSIACGVTARILASLRRDPNIETAFVAGLLHDIGRLILFKEKGAEMTVLLSHAKKSNQLLFEAEQNYFGFNHAQLGGLLLKEWKLPAHHIETTTHHHALCAEQSHSVETATVHIADIIANSMIKGSSGEIFVPNINIKAWKLLRLEEKTIDFVINELENQFSVAVDFVLESYPDAA